MIKTKLNHGLGKSLIILGILLACMTFFAPVLNADDDRRVELEGEVKDDYGASSELNAYKQELENQGESESDAETVALDHIINTLLFMEASQDSVQTKYEELKNRVDAMHPDDTRRDNAMNAKNKAKKAKDDFTGLNVVSNFEVEIQIGGVSPLVKPSKDFLDAEKAALDDLSKVNKILIAPSRPGSVPQGDILEDLAPQLIRQLFRFAWLAVLISFVVSGVMFIISFDNEEHISRAKRMIYFTLLGFAFVSLAFAIVKAITDIDFFRFI